MYLKKLEIHGFKSFADKITIDFRNGITGIVGPNGSGKSNIIDSVRWVLGEQSPKTLRGSRMEDIIFNGTSHRKPLGMAEVSLTFDNSEKFLPIDYSEVTITRRLYRSGESEYLINKTPCRLKDIRELIMDTGIGIDGYSLIGQGQIDGILSNKPDERRQIFEEAAGIVKYKSRKLEAEKKLSNTNQNIVRIEDIIVELETRIQPLKIQSEKAKKFLDLSEELKKLEINIFLREIEDIKLKLKAEEEQFHVVNNQHADYLSKKQSVSSEQLKCQQKIEELNNDIQSMKENYFETTNLLKKLEGERILYKEKVQNIDKNVSRIRNEIEGISDKDKDINIELSHLLLQKQEFNTLISKKNELLVKENEKYEELGNLINKYQYKLEELKGKNIEVLNSMSSIKSEANSMNTIKENLINRIKRIEHEKRSLSNKKKDNTEKFLEVNNEIKKTKASYNEMLLKKEELIKKNNEYRNKYQDLLNLYEKEKNNLRDLQSQKKLLQAMDRSYEGFSSSVRKTLKLCKENSTLGKGVHGVVAELMTIPKDYEIAMEVALGYSMQYIVCNNEEDAKRIVKHLKENNLGRVTFLPLSNVYSQKNKKNIESKLIKHKGFIGIASNLVSTSNKYDSLFNYLLGNTIIVDNIDSAVDISKTVKKFKIVTLDGDIINPGGTITGGSYKSKTVNVFRRKRKIKELDDKIDDLNKLTTQYKNDLEELKNKLEGIDNKLKDNSISVESIKLTLLKKENVLTNIENQGHSLDVSLCNLDEELKELKSELKDIDESISKKNSFVLSLKKENEELENNIQNMSRIAHEKQNQINLLKEKITSIKIDLASLKEKRDNNKMEIKRIQDSIEVWKNNRLNKEKELSQLEKEKEGLIKKTDNIMMKINDNNVLSKQIEYNINKYTNEKDIWIKRNKELIMKIETIDNALNDLKESLHKIEVKKARLELQNDNLIKKIWEKYELSYMDALNHKSDIEDFNIASKRISSLNRELKKLGEVNISSIKEYEEVNQRYAFLKEQREDLIKAKESLNQVIKELESTMNKQFVKSFKQINENFSEIFNQLFNGGKAKLLLDDYENVLESNIDIVAQPPGKKLQNLNLLSGGEKALTAIALLFSILRTKPTPFCILDEIEAALDDINIFRFAEFLKEFTKNSQFIIITHRKGTMEIIDYLYGITMQEYGVSKVVSVKLSEVAS
ncbi:chromosome segregation protein SMC [Paramaledivibacter caminithermalis]|uniref:Chromosome partition protein Smc n=1 Tax=Paramaledivibacter caminithermalis (strain DSM 15212 / CIP 107654 / DViRD3) TaxID=1121301 RepID=A0A1M6NJH1_PARC5|nr:chromosome segregation protein SMC [Paramaledivibacter caminithermalis]SHJ95830.1 condensin subunit Smc [Paramaledivibacter caminithermalis DSM 15212]